MDLFMLKEFVIVIVVVFSCNLTLSSRLYYVLEEAPYTCHCMTPGNVPGHILKVSQDGDRGILFCRFAFLM